MSAALGPQVIPRQRCYLLLVSSSVVAATVAAIVLLHAKSEPGQSLRPESSSFPVLSPQNATLAYVSTSPRNWSLGERVADPNTPDPTRFLTELSSFIDEEPLTSGVIFVGSSSVRLWSSLAEDFPEYATYNRGFGGSTFPDLLYFHDDLIAKHQPDAVVIYEGDNDVGAFGIHLEVILHDFLECLQ